MVRLGVDIYDKRSLILKSSSQTQCFRIGPRLQRSIPCSRQSINWYQSAWCTTNQNSTFCVSIIIVSGKRKGDERERETLLLCTSIFFFSKQGILLCYSSEYFLSAEPEPVVAALKARCTLIQNNYNNLLSFIVPTCLKISSTQKYF